MLHGFYKHLFKSNLFSFKRLAPLALLLATVGVFLLFAQPTHAASEIYSYTDTTSNKIQVTSGFWSDWYSPAGNADCATNPERPDLIYVCKQDDIYTGTVFKDSMPTCKYVLTLTPATSNKGGAISFKATKATSNEPDTSQAKNYSTNCDVSGASDKRLTGFPKTYTIGAQAKEINADPADTLSGETTEAAKWAIGDTSTITSDNNAKYTDEVIRQTCSERFNNADNTRYYDPAKFKLCVDNATAARVTASSNSANGSSCSLAGIGWIVCPIVTFFAIMTDLLYNWISNYLVVQPLNVDTSSSSNTMYIAWSAMRNIANVAFVVAFLIIIFSQLTSTGVSNYGVKKLLPRLVVAAILVNVSFWVAAIAVDISNVVGNGLYDILRNRIYVGDVVIEANLWETVAGTLLAGTVATGAVVAGAAVVTAGSIAAVGPVALYAFLVFILGVVLALVIAFIILALRQALIIILIVVSPLAFVAMLLPNTEKFFDSWKKALITLLVFYPLFSLLFGGSYLAGMIIIGSASADGKDSATGMTVMIGMVVTILPLWLTPLIARFSTGILSKVAGVVNNKGKGLIDKTRKVRDRKGQLAMHETLGSRNASRNPFSRVYRRVQNSSRTDSDRNKVIDGNNQASYLTSEAGTKMAYKTELANQTTEAASSYNKAYFEESKSTSQAIPADHEMATEIQAARDTQQELDINHNRVNSAKSILQQELATELSTRPAMAARAGGIDPRGQSRVVASANAVIADAESKAIAAEKSTMTRLPVTDLSGTGMLDLNTIMRDTSASAERRAAATGQIMKTGGDTDVHQALDYMSDIRSSAVTPEEIGTATMLQQQLAADMGNRKPISIGQGDMTALGQGTYSGTFSDKVDGRVAGGKLTAQALHGATADELKEIAKRVPLLGGLSNPDLRNIKDSIDQYRGSTNYIKPSREIQEKIDNIYNGIV